MKFHPVTGEFAEYANETAFLDHKLAQTRTLLGFTLVFCTVFYLAFSVTDLAALGFGANFFLLFAARVVVVFTAGTCSWLAYRHPLSANTTRTLASVAEGVALACFMFIAAHRPFEFHWHAMSLGIMLIVVYLYIPNSLINALVLALLATAGFLVLALHASHMSGADLLTMSMLLTLANAFGLLAARRYNRVAREEYLAQMQLQTASHRDHLTACFNRRYLHEHLMGQELMRGQRPGHSLSVILCDIDNFKRINDTYGHADGDAVLRAFAALLGSATRRDIDSVVRYGGEEFLLILPETGLEDGIRLAERLRAMFAASATPSSTGNGTVRTTASFGVVSANFPHVGATQTLRDLIALADTLMYEAKRDGRDCVRALQLKGDVASA
jgi:diguanylate cyclase (GGDEF)-like protein